jgi:glycosyltransferase involved in cell wall biosynthesis
MKIGVDCNPLFDEKKGIGWYLFYILEKFSFLSRETDQFHLFWSSFRKDTPEIPSLLLNRRRVVMQRLLPFPRTLGLLFSRVFPYFPGCLLPPLDLVHFPNYTAFPVKKAKVVITVHDLVFKLFPETVDLKVKLVLNTFLKRSIKLADRIITVSKSTAKDLLYFFPEAEGKIKTIYQGVDRKIFRPMFTEEEDLYSMLGTTEFILSLSTLEPRKNIHTLLKAYIILLREKGPKVPDLVLIGSKGWKIEGFFKEYENLPEELKRKIKFPGYLPREMLPKIYSACRVFAFPSLYEGFGLPVLEAMACGAPVIASKASSIPEVGGNAVIYVDPSNPEELAKSINNVLDSNSLREELKTKSLKRAEIFSWEKTAQETFELYKEALGKG